MMMLLNSILKKLEEKPKMADIPVLSYYEYVRKYLINIVYKNNNTVFTRKKAPEFYMKTVWVLL